MIIELLSFDYGLNDGQLVYIYGRQEVFPSTLFTKKALGKRAADESAMAKDS